MDEIQFCARRSAGAGDFWEGDKSMSYIIVFIALLTLSFSFCSRLGSCGSCVGLFRSRSHGSSQSEFMRLLRFLAGYLRTHRSKRRNSMEELIKRLERVIQTGAPDKDG